MFSEKSQLVIYGAYGFTGELITENAVKNGIKPLIAGRNAVKIKNLAQRYDLEYAVFDLNDNEKLLACLKNAKVLLHCAGPFKHTYKQMIEACIETKTHYLDITGEIEVFEGAATFNERAKKAGIMLMPGTGFDVVPSDCLAAFMKLQLPDAKQLKIAFTNLGSMSRGTMLTMIENLGAGGASRIKGKILEVSIAHKTAKFPFADKKLMCATIPWGDVSTAFYSTGIPNIETYVSSKPSMIRLMKMSNYLGWFLSANWLKSYLKKKVMNGKSGPDLEERKNGYSIFYAEVENDHGIRKSAGLKTPEGYTLTAETSVLIAQKVMQGNFKVGFMTPSLAYGADLILEIENTERFKVEPIEISN